MNPFKIGVISPDEPFCNREKEIKDITNFIKNLTNVLIFSPRRYGKTSLVKKILSQIKKERYYTIYVDFFPITSAEDVLSRFAVSAVSGLGKDVTIKGFGDRLTKFFRWIIPTIDVTPEGFSFSVRFDRTASVDFLLEDIFEGINRYLKAEKKKACIVFDEFQEITALSESKKIQGIMRSYIQEQKNISHLFVGSRRRILLSMFSQKDHPFYKSVMNYPLGKIDKEKFIPYICQQFKNSDKNCSLDITEDLFNYVEGHPYYVQKLSYFLWDITEKKANQDSLEKAKDYLLNAETNNFENVFQGLSSTQKRFLKAIATEATNKPYSKEFTTKYNLSFGGLQKSLRVLLEKDLIEKDSTGIWRLTDPIMAKWLLK
jgi:hypothetical protein